MAELFTVLGTELKMLQNAKIVLSLLLISDFAIIHCYLQHPVFDNFGKYCGSLQWK